jgi:mannosyl-oligosaccharide alpha-1,2-mannosidase
VEERLQQSRNGNNKRDDDEFRMIVQTLKHFYLLFSEPNMLSLDTWVFTSDGGVLWAGNP